MDATADDRTLRDLILRVSAELAGAPDGAVDGAVERALAEVGRCTGADRAYVMRFDHAERSFSNTHEWVADGVAPMRERVQGLSLDVKAPWMAAFERGEAVVVDDVAALPEGAAWVRDELRAQGVASALWVPLPGPSAPLGFVGFDAVGARRSWQPAEVDLLRAVTNVIAGALVRVDATSERDVASERLRALATLLPGVVYQYQVEPDGHTWYPYVSPRVVELTGCSPEDLANDGAVLLERLHPDDRAPLVEANDRSRRDLGLWSVEFRLLDEAGTWRWVRGRALPERRPHGATRWHGVIVDVTAERDLARALEQRQSDLARITDTLRDVVVLTDAELLVRYVSPSVREALGYGPDEVLGRHVTAFLHEDELAIATHHLATGFRERDGGTLTHRMRHRDGSVRYFESLVHVLDEAEGAVFSARDVTERVAEQRRLEREVAFRSALVGLTNDLLAQALDEGFYQRLLERALELVPDAEGGSLLLRDDDHHYRFGAAVGFDLAALQTIRLHERVLGRRTDGVERIMVHDVLEGLSAREQEVLRGPGRLDEIRATLTVPIRVAGVLRGYVNLNNFERDDVFGPETHDVAAALGAQVGIALQRLQLERDLDEERRRFQRLASHDALTELPNRRLFQDRLEQSIARAQRADEAVALAYVDLDGFKGVNDTYGHAVGDELLVAVARRLAGLVRAADTVARLGGDEFAVVIGNVGSGHDVRAVADKVLVALSEPFELSVGDVVVGASVGLARFPDDGSDGDALMRAADLAMYRVKLSGKGAYAFFAESER